MTYAQISISGVSPTEPEEQIRENFGLSNMYLHSIEIQGNKESFGMFINGSNNIRQYKGIVLSTGVVNEAEGNASDLLSSDQNAPGFPAFDDLYDAGGTFDAAYLRVIFTPFADKVQLPFVLASENYDNHICKINNDWLGIFVRPEEEWGSSNWENLATVPGKPNIPVTPNTVNRKYDVEDQTECARLDSTWNWNDPYFNPNVSGIKYNGATANILTRKQTVIPGKRYELIIVIADGYDPYNDSAVFLPGFNHVNAKPYRKVESYHQPCVGQSLQVGDSTITESGVYIVKLTDEDAEIDTFAIATVSFRYRTRSTTHYICPGESVAIGDTVLFEPVLDFPDTVEIEGQCHQIVYHDIFYKTGDRTEKYHQLCSGDVLEIGNQIFTTDGSFEELVVNPNACDEYIMHHFSFSASIYTEQIYEACTGDTVWIENNPYTSSTSFQRQFVASGGCDSIVHYQVFFDAPYHKIIRQTPSTINGIPFDTVFIADTFFTRNDIYYEYIEVPDGCDTIVEHRMDFRHLEIITDPKLDTNLCVGETYNIIYGEDFYIRKDYNEWIQRVEDSIRGNSNGTIKSHIHIDAYPADAIIEKETDLAFVGISLDHDRITDLDISITCPTGKSALLTRRAESDYPVRIYADSTTHTFWSPYHTQTWHEFGLEGSVSIYPRSDFRSAESFDKLSGCPINGTWTMTATDYWEEDNGFWWSWSLGFPNTRIESMYQPEEQLVWGWFINSGNARNLEIQAPDGGSVFQSLDIAITPSDTGRFELKCGSIMNRNADIADFSLSLSVTNNYNGPQEELDTILCTPTILYDSLITQSGTYELIKDHPDYCDGIPVIVHVTAIPPDTTFLSTTTCEFSDSDLNIETLSNQYGCDSLIFTGIQLVVDTMFSQNISCLPNITTINRSFETLEVVMDNACDYVSIIEHIEVPIDTTYLEEIVCDPEAAGVTTVVFPNQFGCDSVIITDHILALDTTYISSTTCQFEDAGIQQITLTNRYGCDSLIIADVVLEVDTVFTSPIECNPAIDAPSTEIVIENINVEDGCDYVSVQEVLSAPIDTTYLVTPSCQVRDSLPVVEVLDNQFGCDSVVITSFNLRFDTLTHIINTCTAGIASPQQLIDTEWLINENACDTFQITITNLLPLDTTLVTMASCNPQDTGTFYQTLPNQYLCDSIVITEVEFDPDTLYLATNTCYPQDSGWHLQILEQVDGCQTLEWTYRQYIPLEYDWLIAADTCGFGQGSASFVPTNSDLDYAFEWDGPAVDIDPAALFQGVYNVTITATGDTYPETCVDTSRVIIGGISALPKVNFSYQVLDLDYQFSSEIIEADTFYWDFGEGNTSAEANPAHTFAETGTYTVCLIAQNGCGTQQDCQAVVTLKDYSIGGKIETAPNFPASSGINGVKVKLSGEQVNLEGNSNAEGSFTFPKQLEGYDYALQPEKEDDILNGLDVSDILKIAQAANGSRQLEAPYELLAADVNCDASITTEDALYLNQLLLGQQDQFPEDCPSWIFWPQSYVFPTPAEPFNPNSSILIENLQTGSLQNDFYGLKRGDLGANADAARSPTELDTLFLQIENGIIQAGDTVQLDFRVRNFSELVGVQFEFLIDTFALTFHDISLGDLEPMTMEHFGTDGFEQGILRVIWLDILGQPHSLADGDVLFSLQLIAKQKINDRQSKMEISTRDLAASYFNEALEEGVVQLLVDDLVDIVNVNNEFFQLGQNRPNPFQQTTIIPFNLSTSAPVKLKIYSQLGQLIWQQEGRFPAGKTELEINIDTPGLYYYSIDTPWGKATRKMVKVE